MVLLSIFLLTVKSKRKLPHHLFASFLLVTAIDLSGFFILDPLHNSIQSLKVSSVLIQMPLFYLYVQAACYFNFKLQLKHLIHGVPFIFFLILFLATNTSDNSLVYYNIVSKIQYYSYIAAILLTLRKFKKLYQENYSSNYHQTYKWILQTVLLFLIGNTFVLIRYFIPSGSPIFLTIGINLTINVFALVIMSLFVLKALYHPKLFMGVDKSLSPIILKYEDTNDFKVQEKLSHLANYMLKEKPYLDPELTIQQLAIGINIPEKQLSLLINQYLDSHFFDFINQYRINDAKTLLKDNTNLTVLEVLYSVGFNSKSSFYTAFKKETNQTPTAYRKSNI